MKKQIRVAGNGDSAPRRTQVKRPAKISSKAAGPSAKKSPSGKRRAPAERPKIRLHLALSHEARLARFGEPLVKFTEGLSTHTLYQRGKRFTHVFNRFERFTGRRWREITYDTAGVEFGRAVKHCEPRKGREGQRIESLLRTVLQSERLSYNEALYLVRDRILNPAIGEAIPHCFSRDLWVNVVTTVRAGRRTEQRLHIVGANPVEIPPGMELARI